MAQRLHSRSDIYMFVWFLLSVEHSGVAEMMTAHLLCARRGGVVAQRLPGCGLLGSGGCVVVGVGVSCSIIVEPGQESIVCGGEI